MMFLPEGSGPTLLFLAGAALAIFLLLRRSYRYFGRQKSVGPALPRASLRKAKSDEPLLDMPPPLARWQVELHTTARELKAEIDSKLSLLQILVVQAREESQRLEAALDRADRLGLPVERDRLAEIEFLCSDLAAEARESAQPAARREDSESDEASGKLPGTPDQRRRIYLFANQGRATSDIAERVGLPTGEVEILLGLRV